MHLHVGSALNDHITVPKEYSNQQIKGKLCHQTMWLWLTE